MGWLCLGVSMGLCVLLQDLCRAAHPLKQNLIERRNSVMSPVLYLSGRHEGKIAELHLPTLLLFQLMVGAVKPSQGSLGTSWHPPRPLKHDGWESWRVWII